MHDNSKVGMNGDRRYLADEVYPYNKSTGTLKARVVAIGARTIEQFSVDEFDMVFDNGNRLLFSGAQVQRIKGGVCMILYGKLEAKHSNIVTLKSQVTFDEDKIRLTYRFKKVDGNWTYITAKVEKCE